MLSSIPRDRRAVSAGTLDCKSSAAVGERPLGVRWDISNNQFRFAVHEDTPYMDECVSVACLIFDPRGFLPPVILLAKKFVQDMTRQKLGWDNPLSKCDEKCWKQWIAELQNVTMFTSDRYVSRQYTQVKLDFDRSYIFSMPLGLRIALCHT